METPFDHFFDDRTNPPTPVGAALGHFQQYLRQEHSLSEATVINYTPVARSFLSERFPEGALHFQQITAADITAFVQRQATLITSKRAPLVVTALRSFLRYLFHRGIVPIDLAACVPTIATWSLSNVPRFLAGEQIQKILGLCDKETAIGRRDYALLLLLALGSRLGHGARQGKAGCPDACAIRSGNRHCCVRKSLRASGISVCVLGVAVGTSLRVGGASGAACSTIPPCLRLRAAGASLGVLPATSRRRRAPSHHSM